MATVTLDTAVSKTTGSDSLITTITKGALASATYDETYNYERADFIAAQVAAAAIGYVAGAMKGEKVATGRATYALPQFRLL